MWICGLTDLLFYLAILYSLTRHCLCFNPRNLYFADKVKIFFKVYNCYWSLSSKYFHTFLFLFSIFLPSESKYKPREVTAEVCHKQRGNSLTWFRQGGEANISEYFALCYLHFNPFSLQFNTKTKLDKNQQITPYMNSDLKML